MSGCPLRSQFSKMGIYSRGEKFISFPGFDIGVIFKVRWKKKFELNKLCEKGTFENSSFLVVSAFLHL